MNVLLDISRSLEPQLTGIGVYQKELFSNLKNLCGDDVSLLPIYYGKRADFINISSDVLPLYNKYYFSLRKRLYDRFFISPKLRSKFNADFIFHSTAYRCISGIEDRTVMTIHDLAFILYKDQYSSLYYKIVTHYLPRVARIIVISNYVRSVLMETFPQLDEKKVRIVFQGVGNRIKPIKNVNELYRFKERVLGLRKEEDYILFLGAITTGKNVLGILDAFSKIKNHHEFCKLKLILAGKPRNAIEMVEKRINESNLKSDIIYIPDPDKIVSKLLSAAKVFVFPSFYEGFGLPVLEAMKCGVPVVTSNVTALGELFSDSAIAVDPKDTDAIAEGVYNLLTNDKLRQDLIKKGYNKANEFTWERTAKKTLEVYKELF